MVPPGKLICDDIQMRDFIVAFYIIHGEFFHIEDPHSAEECKSIREWLSMRLIQYFLHTNNKKTT